MTTNDVRPQAEAELRIDHARVFFAEAGRWALLLLERHQRQLDGGDSAGATLYAAPSPLSILTAQASALHDALTDYRQRPEQNRADHPFGRIEVLCDLAPLEADLLLLAIVMATQPALAERRRALAAHHPGLGRGLSAELATRLLDPAGSRPHAIYDALRVLGPLRLHRLIDVTQDADGLGARIIEVPEPVVAHALGSSRVGDGLRATATVVPPIDLERFAMMTRLHESLVRTLAWCRGGRSTARRVLLIGGPDARFKEAALAAVAATQSRRVLRIDLRSIGIAYREPELTLLDHFREATLGDSIPYLDAHGADDLPEEVRLRLAAAIDVYPRTLVIGHDGASTVGLRIASACVSLHIGALDATHRAHAWAVLLAREGVPTPTDEVLGEIGRRHALDFEAIGRAATQVAAQHAISDARRRPPSPALLDEAARRAGGATLARFATRVEAGARWEDLVVPEPTRRGLDEMVGYVVHGDQVFAKWGFARRFGSGASLTALFAGPPGTGKTMAASLIANRLGKELYVIDVARVTSMWIGETEKNLGALFEQAGRGEVMILFDEADSLFAKRTDVKSSSDRYANLGVNYLLQRLESFEGVAILTTNRADAIDEAFRRRLRFRLEFPMPAADERARLWQSMVPPECRVDEPIDWEWLGAKFEISGGHIKNALLRAAFLAAGEGSGLTFDLVNVSANEEYRALGRVVRDVPGRAR